MTVSAVGGEGEVDVLRLPVPNGLKQTVNLLDGGKPAGSVLGPVGRRVDHLGQSSRVARLANRCV